MEEVEQTEEDGKDVGRTKITINVSWHVFARALGVQNPQDPNSQLPAEIRLQMIETFTNRYLRGIVNTVSFEALEKRLRAYAESVATRLYGTIKEGRGWRDPVVFKPSPAFVEAMERYVTDSQRTEISRLAQDADERIKGLTEECRTLIYERADKLKKQVDDTAERVLASKSEAALEARINTMVNDALKIALDKRLAEMKTQEVVLRKAVEAVGLGGGRGGEEVKP